MLKSRFPAIAVALPEVVERALKVGAEQIADSARARVPQRSGALHDSIHVDTESEGVYVVAGDSAVFYGHIVEHGSVNTPPRPFLIPAFEENRTEVVGLVDAALSRL